jgi:aspartyl-tRNA(Asn)/glutamyl-tRNA(Gln) amidotransferase subunit C
MKIDDKTLDRIAELAQIEIADDDRERLKADMSSVLDWVEKLNELDTDDSTAITQMALEINRLRNDEEVNNFSQEQATRNAKEKKDGFFVVPKVIRK